MASPSSVVPSVIISILIFTAVIAGGFSIISAFLPDDDNSFSGYNTTFNKFETMRSNSESLSEDIRSPPPEQGALGFLNGLVKTAWAGLTQVWLSIDTMVSIITNFPQMNGINIPPWFTGLMISIILIVMVFAIIAMLLKAT